MLISDAQRDALADNLVTPIFEGFFEALGKDIALVKEFLGRISHPASSGQVFDHIIQELKKSDQSFGLTVQQLQMMVSPKPEEIEWFFNLGDPRTNIYDFKALVHELLADMIRKEEALVLARDFPMTEASTEKSAHEATSEGSAQALIQDFSAALSVPDLTGAVQYYREDNGELRAQLADQADNNSNNAIIAEIALENPITVLIGLIEKFHKLPDDQKKEKESSLKRIKQFLLALQKRQELAPTQPKFDLSGIDFSRIDLSEIDFSDMKLENCNFQHATLNGCNFTSALLSKSNFSSAKMSHVVLAYADLTGTNLRMLISFCIDDVNMLEDVILTKARLDRTALLALIPLAQ